MNHKKTACRGRQTIRYVDIYRVKERATGLEPEV
jgi:hypothetical protein